MTDTNKTFYISRWCCRYIVYGVVLVVTFLLFDVGEAFGIDEEFSTHCNKDEYDAKYAGADCWSCDIVKVLMRSLSQMANVLYNAIMELCNIILSLGAAIWLAIYLLKAVGSLATQDPAKIIDGAMVFFFKWAFVYTLLVFGMDTLIENIVNPLLSIGWDIGKAFADGAGIG